MFKKLFVLMCIVVAVLCLYLHFSPDLEGNQNNQESISESADDNYLTIDFDSLKVKNSDIIGWINIPESDCYSYPLVESHDNQEYLTTSFEENDDSEGTPFVDMNCSKDFSDFNTLIYSNYTFEDSEELYIYTLDHTVKIYRIVAKENAEVSSSLLFKIGNMSDLAKSDFIDQMLKNSEYDYNTECSINDHFLNLICLEDSTQNQCLVVSYKLIDEVNLA